MKKSQQFPRTSLLWGLAALLAAAGPALATYEVSEYTPDIPTNTATKLTDDLNVILKKPDTGTDTFTGFVYFWSRSAATMGDADLNEDKASTFGSLGGFISATVLSNDQTTVTLDASNFTDDDYADLWYLHVKTQYLDSSLVEHYSDDAALGPFNIDNVVDGTITVVDADGQTISETRETRLNVKVAPPGDLASFYLAETPSKPATTTTVPDSKTVTYDLTDTTTGNRTLYAWFEDQAGNVSTSPATASFTLLPSVSISPNTVTIDLATTTTQTFSIEGSSAGYDWSVTTETPETSGEDVCQLSGTTTNTTSVTLTALNPGTCVLQAALTSDTTQTITSGTITVTQSGVTITHAYVKGLNLVPFTLTGTGIAKASELDAAIVAANPGVTVSQIFGWDAANQRFATPYANLGSGFSTGDFTLVPGNAYFVETSGTGSLALKGTDYTSLTLEKGLNLIAVPMGKSSAVAKAADLDSELAAKTGATVSQIFGWDAANQRFATPYANLGSGFTTGDFTLNHQGEGYFVELSAGGTYTP